MVDGGGGGELSYPMDNTMHHPRRKTVAVFGAGIAGLSAAHELAEQGFSVTVYEQLMEPGGVARSSLSDTGIPSEYSWRGYGPWYHNVFNLMRRIPTAVDDKSEKPQTVYDSLSRPVNFVFTGSQASFLAPLSWRDRCVIAYEMAKNATASARRRAEYATINAAAHLKPWMSTRGWAHFVSMFGPWIGIDPQRASLHHIMSFLVKNVFPGSFAPYRFSDESGEWNMGALSGWAVLKEPTNDGWFGPWVSHLERAYDVKFQFGASMQRICRDMGGRGGGGAATVGAVEVIHRGHQYTGLSENVVADHYVVAISPFALQSVAERSGMQRSVEGLGKLLQDGPHTQVSFRIAFSRAVWWPGQRTAVILSDSEFNITMYRQDELWDGGVSDYGIASLWSGTACVAYKRGSLFDKPLVALTKYEFEQEILHQLSKDRGFDAMLTKANNGRNFDAIAQNMVQFEVWDGWTFRPDAAGGDDDDHGRTVTASEPKYVDSTNTRAHQPSAVTGMANLWLAGAHTLTTADLWSMEGAAESGRRAASLICEKCPREIRQDTGVIRPLLQAVDTALYTGGLPNVLLMMIVFLFALIASTSSPLL